MSTYRYRAVSASGEAIEGEMEAPSAATVAQRLADQGHTPVRAEEATVAPVRRRDLLVGLRIERRASRKSLAIATHELATLLDAGVPLDRGLEILGSVTEDARFRSATARVLDAVRGGESLADAMAKRGDVFPAFYASMVRAGEASGRLAGVLERLGSFLERSQAVAERIRSAMVYPVILVIVSLLSLVVLVVGVIPQFRPLFESAGQALPLPMQVLLAVSQTLRAYWWGLAVAALAGFLGMRAALARPRNRLALDHVWLRIPVLGSLARQTEGARFARMLATLLANGVPMLSALGIARETMGNLALRDAVSRAAAAVKEGDRLSQALAREAALPEMALSLLRVGEETGVLEGMLERVADILERDVQHGVDRLLALLVPGLTVALGLVVAVIVVALLSAVLGANQLAI